MQRTIYECDECLKEIGKQDHLSLSLAGNGNASGIALAPVADSARWVVSGFPRTFLHFHVKCVGKYMEAYAKTKRKDYNEF